MLGRRSDSAAEVLARVEVVVEVGKPSPSSPWPTTRTNKPAEARLQ